MTDERDISWKDLLALFVGYLISGVCIAVLFLGLVSLCAQGILPKETFFLYELPIGIATFIGFVIGGTSLAEIRPSVALRNAAVLFVIMVFMGVWRTNDDMVSIQDAFVTALQMSGLMVGTWFIQHRYVARIVKT